MKRRALVFAGLLVPLPAFARGPVTVVNVSAWNCSYCLAWMKQQKPEWVASPEYRRVRYVEINSPTIRQAYKAEHWPADLHGILDRLATKNGTPRFLLVQKDDVVFNEFGLSGWPKLLSRLRAMLD